MIGTSVHHPAVTAVMAAAADLLGMEVVYVSGMTEDEFRVERLFGQLPGVYEGLTLPRQDSMCDRLLAGAPSHTADAANDPAYADSPTRVAFDICSYVGVPVRAPDGTPVGTLCGIDRGHVPVAEDALQLLQLLVRVIEAHIIGNEPAAVIRRTPTGWQVGDNEEKDLTSAMVLADLLAGDLSAAGRPPRASETGDEMERLRVAVGQLEHALAARVVVEQAIGVLAERQHLAPRAAFERLRKAARSRGRKVHELAKQVVASSTDPAVPLPPELAGRR